MKKKKKKELIHENRTTKGESSQHQDISRNEDKPQTHDAKNVMEKKMPNLTLIKQIISGK